VSGESSLGLLNVSCPLVVGARLGFARLWLRFESRCLGNFVHKALQGLTCGTHTASDTDVFKAHPSNALVHPAPDTGGMGFFAVHRRDSRSSLGEGE